MTEAYGCVQGRGGIKRGDYVRISTVYFPVLSIFSIKKRKMKMIKLMEFSLTLHTE